MTDWDTRYRQGQYVIDPPHPLITHFGATLTPGRALDLACGTGRHAIWLAEHGWSVTAVDSSREAIEILQRRAVEKTAVVSVLVADLERHDFVIERDSYDLIVVCNYLQRDLFPSIREGTRAGGLVIAVIAMVDDDPDIKPMNPSFLLNPGDLRGEFERWELMHDFEGKPLTDQRRRAVAEVVARRPFVGTTRA
jgi:SAM-dependent methyltransferase